MSEQTAERPAGFVDDTTETASGTPMPAHAETLDAKANRLADVIRRALSDPALGADVASATLLSEDDEGSEPGLVGVELVDGSQWFVKVSGA